MTGHGKTVALLLGLALAPAWGLMAQDPAPQRPPTQETAKDVAKKVEKGSAQGDGKLIASIKEEGLKHSQVMATLDTLTNAIGPRLTASPGMKRANAWTRDKLAEWGLKDPHLEAWGPFGRGWTLRRFSAQVVEPQCIPLIAYPMAWSPGLPAGPIVGDVVLVDAKNEADLGKFKGKLRDAVVLVNPAIEVPAHFTAPGIRLTEVDLLKLADAPEPRAPAARRGFPGRGGPGGGMMGPVSPFLRKRAQFFLEEGVAAVASPSRIGDGGTVFVAAAPRVPRATKPEGSPLVAPYAKEAGPSTPQIALAVEHYNRLVRMIKQGESPRAALDLAVQFHDDDPMGYNTVAEIPGTDLKDELVMLGGHMDSWHAGTGATDNAAGVAVAMEAVRILQALKLTPRRTIRIALWSGEEQGLLGSRAYVKEHFGGYDDRPEAFAAAVYETLFTGERPSPKLAPTSDHQNVSAYFNLDNGSGKIRGIYLEGNEAVRPIFRKWLEPFREMGAATISIAPTGGTDHMSFDSVGIPGFQFIQDPIEYNARTHHSNMDTYERIQADDLKQAAVIMAAFVYNTAMRDEKLPRKPDAPK